GSVPAGPTDDEDPADAPAWPNLARGGSAHWRKVVTLAHPLRTNSPIFPGDPAFTIETFNTVAADGYLLERVSLGTHTGTHVSAPCHFIDGAPCIDDLPAKTFIRPLVVIDVRARVAQQGGDFQVTKADIRSWENANGKIPEGAIVLLNTGFGSKFFTPAYLNDAPGFAGAAATWLMKPVSEGGRGAAGTGSDTFGPDATTDSDYSATYNTLLANGVTIENATRLDKVPAQGATIIFLPARLNNGSGYQTNIIALVP
ncbi:MAG TPA: cyclase family protein, partial [Myxococcota bacterium]